MNHTQFRMEQMDRYHFCSMWSRPTICFFQLQGMSKTSCHFRPDKKIFTPLQDNLAMLQRCSGLPSRRSGRPLPPKAKVTRSNRVGCANFCHPSLRKGILNRIAFSKARKLLLPRATAVEVKQYGSMARSFLHPASAWRAAEHSPLTAAKIPACR